MRDYPHNTIITMPITKRQRQQAIIDNICIDCRVPQKGVTVNEKGFCPRHAQERKELYKQLTTSSIHF